MQKRFWGILFCIVMCCNTAVMAATPESNGTLVRAVVSHGDTVFVLPTVYAFPPMKFKNKREEKFYWRTVRDVKKVASCNIFL